MPLILTNTQDREECFAILRLAIDTFLLPAVSPEQREAVYRHFANLAASSDVLGLDCQLQGDSHSTSLKITINRRAQ
jgi:hypothetical protein